MPDTLLRLADVKERTALSHPTIYRLIRKGEFPAPAKIGRLARWHSAGIDTWIAQHRNDDSEVPA